MKVAFHLRRRAEAEVAAAALLEVDSVEALLGEIATLGGPRPPEVHRVVGGFLLIIGPGDGPRPGSTRLHALAARIYLPADADLVPTLLDDEAQGLTRDRGLVFLPGGRVLAYDPADAVDLAGLASARRLEGGPWRSFPPRPPQAERLREISLELPGLGEVDPLDPTGDPGPVVDSAEAGGAGLSTTDQALARAGRGLLTGLKGLIGLGAAWIGRASGPSPSVTEAMLGKQEGALRELIRQFREGDVERALRHALPLGGPSGRGGIPSAEGNLPEINPTYSLQSILGQGQTTGGLWFGGADLQAELAGEYRKAAEEAERRGDDRRAAYIHGKLRGDFPSAAACLSRAGLHRDAAYVYLNRLGDLAAAARSFEAAGEVDRALDLYRRARRHAEAGDLLRKVGEEAEALEEYSLAADLLAADPWNGPIAAGDLLRDRARRPDLALGRYAEGWELRDTTDRNSANAIPCALRMATILAEAGRAGPLVELVDRVDEVLRKPGSEAPAVDFYNELALLADREGLTGVRDDLRDRALMGLASKLREQVDSFRRPGQLASGYFGRNRTWSPSLVGDATLAIKAAAELEAERRRPGRPDLGTVSGGETRRIESIGGVVSAACHCPPTGEVFLGFEGGQVARFHAASGLVSCLAEESGPILSMAFDPHSRILVALVGDDPGPRHLLVLDGASTASDWSRHVRPVEGPGEFWLTPVISDRLVRGVGVWNGEEMILMGGRGELGPWSRLPMPFLKTKPPAALLVPSIDGQAPLIRAILIHDDPDICQVEAMGKMVRRRLLGWGPTLVEGQALRSAPLAWLQVEPTRFELAGLDRDGIIHWSALKVNDAELIRLSNLASRGEGYLAATLVRPGLIAGVAQSRVDWFRCGPMAFLAAGSAPLEADNPEACFHVPGIEELVVVCRDGTLLCVPTPR